MDRGVILLRVETILGPLLDAEGFSLVDVEYKRERRGWVLRVFIDKESGVTLDDCARVSREFGQLLDVEDIIPTSYQLEVSSPGLDRPLKKEEDFVKYSGRKVRIKTKEQVSGRRNFKGALLGCTEGKVMVKVEGSGVFTIPFSAILKANLEIELN
ncbi:MAG: ribosome maturation factor RimP [Deltaproteobacteria bacterium]